MYKIINQLAISHIDIEDLFGIYSYSIPLESMDISKLLILYGENGAGKTTILTIIFNLLSSEESKGHKKELANIKFKKLSIELSNGYNISAIREDSLVGSYRLELRTDKETLSAECTYILEDEEYNQQLNQSENKKLKSFVNKLSSIELSIDYITYNRIIKNNNVNISNFPMDMLKDRKKTISEDDKYLKISVQILENWFAKQANIGESIGELDIENIYFKLMTSLLDEDKQKTIESHLKINKKELLMKLKDLDKRNQDFVKYTLSSDYNIGKYIELIDRISEDNIKLIYNTLNTHIESIKKRLDAMQELRDIIDIFITVLNDFYSGKKLSFSKSDGIKINSLYNDKELLDPITLSSGEKQLLLLFCNTITARDKASICIIDEPELSLNVVWQRKLIDTLLKFADGSSMQFIFASHSIELLTKYDENVCALKNIKKF